MNEILQLTISKIWINKNLYLNLTDIHIKCWILKVLEMRKENNFNNLFDKSEEINSVLVLTLLFLSISHLSRSGIREHMKKHSQCRILPKSIGKYCITIRRFCIINQINLVSHSYTRNTFSEINCGKVVRVANKQFDETWWTWQSLSKNVSRLQWNMK